MKQELMRRVVFLVLRSIGIVADMENGKITISTEVNFTGGVEVNGGQVGVGPDDSVGMGFAALKIPNP